MHATIKTDLDINNTRPNSKKPNFTIPLHFELYIVYCFSGAPGDACTVNNISTVFTKQCAKLNSIWCYWSRRQIALEFDWGRLQETGGKMRGVGGSMVLKSENYSDLFF